MQQSHLFITGDVQGVGFRQFVRYKARKFGVSGWVRNLSDGRVEAMLQGDKPVLEQMIAICRKGPPIAHVKDISITWEAPQQIFDNFTIFKSEYKDVL
jgi:acylphosphatase